VHNSLDVNEYLVPAKARQSPLGTRLPLPSRIRGSIHTYIDIDIDIDIDR